VEKAIDLVDTHCHLDAAEFDADRSAVYRAAKVGAGGTALAKIVVPAVERANFGAVASVCREYPGCVPAYGIHPLYVDRARPEDLDALRATLRREPAVAIGEIGLDRHEGDNGPRDDAQQLFYFVEQLKIAREFDLPVLLHVRKAIDPILKCLRENPVPGGIAHAFNGSREQAAAFIKLGFKLGFGGAMTFERALHIRELAATLPGEAVVLETDAPDIPPVWLERGRNAPQELPRIAAMLAGLRQVDTQTVAGMTTRNAVTVLPGLQALLDAGCRA